MNRLRKHCLSHAGYSQYPHKKTWFENWIICDGKILSLSPHWIIFRLYLPLVLPAFKDLHNITDFRVVMDPRMSLSMATSYFHFYSPYFPRNVYFFPLHYYSCQKEHVSLSGAVKASCHMHPILAFSNEAYTCIFYLNQKKLA